MNSCAKFSSKSSRSRAKASILSSARRRCKQSFNRVQNSASANKMNARHCKSSDGCLRKWAPTQISRNTNPSFPAPRRWPCDPEVAPRRSWRPVIDQVKPCADRYKPCAHSHRAEATGPNASLDKQNTSAEGHHGAVTTPVETQGLEQQQKTHSCALIDVHLRHERHHRVRQRRRRCSRDVDAHTRVQVQSAVSGLLSEDARTIRTARKPAFTSRTKPRKALPRMKVLR